MYKTVKFSLLISDSKRTWEKEYEHVFENENIIYSDVQIIANHIIAYLNYTLKKGESPRELLSFRILSISDFFDKKYVDFTCPNCQEELLVKLDCPSSGIETCDNCKGSYKYFFKDDEENFEFNVSNI